MAPIFKLWSRLYEPCLIEWQVSTCALRWCLYVSYSKSNFQLQLFQRMPRFICLWLWSKLKGADSVLISWVKGKYTNLRLDHWYLLDSFNVHFVWDSLKLVIILVVAPLTNFNGIQKGNVLDWSKTLYSYYWTKIIHQFTILFAALSCIYVTSSSYLLTSWLSIYWIISDHVWINMFLWNITSPIVFVCIHHYAPYPSKW